MPTRTLTADEADEFDTRKKLRAAKALLDAKENALRGAQEAVAQARKVFDDTRNEYLRKFGNPV